MHADLLPPLPVPGARERRAAALALVLSLALHLAALGLLPKAPDSAVPPAALIQVTLLPPVPAMMPPALPAPALPAPVLPAPVLPAQAAAPRPAPAAQARPAPARPAVVARPDFAPAAARVAAPAARPEALAVPMAATAESPPAAAPAIALAPAVPPPVAPAVAAPAAPAVDSGQLDRYGRTLADLLARQQQYPRLAAARGWEGDVVLKLVIARKGQLVTARVVRSSGHAVLDEHALALVAGVQPFPALPETGPEDSLEVTVPVHYQLRKG